MKTCFIKIICIITAIFFIATEPGLAKRDRVKISDPSLLKKIPIAIPLFKTLPYRADISKKTSDTCAETLAFTSYFKILDRGSYLATPQETDVTGSNLNFGNWTAIGADLLITGAVQTRGDMIEMELRLFDPFKGQLLVGKKYNGRLNNSQKMIRLFCSEVMHHLTGARGVFNSEIAFVSNGSGNKEIYTCDFDGQNVTRFTHHRTITLFPAWSSDGKWMAYTSYARGKPDIYIKHLKEKRGFVIKRKGINITPEWVPGQFRLAATLSYEGDQEIYLLSGEGRVIKRLTRNWGIDTSPAWSPDGGKMAFVSNRSGKPQIHIMHLNSGRVERLTFQGKYNTQPNWSPKGDKIAYSARGKNGRFNICVIGFDGRGPVQLTRNSGDNEAPSWSPDGSMITFSSTRGGSARIYVMTAGGSEQRRLVALPGEQTNPKWSPGIGN